MLRTVLLLALSGATLAACARSYSPPPNYPPSNAPPPSAPSRHKVTPPPPPIEVVRPKVP